MKGLLKFVGDHPWLSFYILWASSNIVTAIIEATSCVQTVQTTVGL